MTTTSDLVIARLPEKPRPQKRGNVIRCASPLRPDSNSLSFALCIHDDGEHGWFKDHVSGDAGSLYTLAERLGIEPTPYREGHRGPDKSADSGSIAYRGLADYASTKGVDADVFARAGWRDGTHQNRPAIIYPVTVDGQKVERVRYLDGQGSKYTWAQSGGKAGWYGLQRAVKTARDNGRDILYIVNGEASVVVAMHHGIPAAAVTGGESTFKAEHVQELLSAWDGHIAIALDCDAAGRNGAERRKSLIIETGPDAAERVSVVDLGLHNKGDMADFCMLFADDENKDAVWEALVRVTPRPTIAGRIMESAFVSLSDAMRLYREAFEGNPEALKAVSRPVPITWEPARVLVGDYAAGGKIIMGPVSTSGGGKTIVLEEWVMQNIMSGVRTLLISPEWAPDEFAQRYLMRFYVGADFGHAKMPNYVEWLAEMANLQRGYRSTITDPNVIRYMEHAMKRVEEDLGNWLEIFNIRSVRSTQMVRVLELAQKRIDHYKRIGKPIDMVFFDYVSVFDLDERKANEAEALLGLVKEFAMINNVLVVTSSQINKEASRRITLEGGRIYIDDIFSARPDKLNYILIATPHYLTWRNIIERGGTYTHPMMEHEVMALAGKRDLDTPARDEGGALMPSGLVVLSSAKNSVKGGARRLYLQMDYSSLRVWDFVKRGGLPPDWTEVNGRLEYIGPRVV